MNRYAVNKYRNDSPFLDIKLAKFFREGDFYFLHKMLPGYFPTPVISLPSLADKLELKSILVKDESHRLGLKAFKALGASYATYRFLKKEWERYSDRPFLIEDWLAGKYSGQYIFCTATDGNHGRAVAWTAKILGQKAEIFMPKGTVPARIENIEKEGARVTIVDGSYDDTVRQAASEAEKNGWVVISDTAYEGYTEIPGYIMAGYLTMFHEMADDLANESGCAVDTVIFQGGVGSFAASGAWYFSDRFGSDCPKLISVEPVGAACLLESIEAENGEPKSIAGDSHTIMAGLNCGTPSILAWPIIRSTFDLFLAIEDDWAETAMRQYHYPRGGDPQIESGESGAAGLAGLLALIEDENLRKAKKVIGLDENSRILLVNTEGATDPDNFAAVTKS